MQQLSKEEQKRQDVIYELIHTEEQYLQDLLIITDVSFRAIGIFFFPSPSSPKVFWQPMQKRQLLPYEEEQILFSNISELSELSTSFLQVFPSLFCKTHVLIHVQELQELRIGNAVVSEVGDLFLQRVIPHCRS